MLLLQADQGVKVTVIHSSKLVCRLIRAYVEDTDDDIPMPEGPPPGLSKDEEEVDTDDDIPMPDGLLRVAQVSRTHSMPGVR